jgi:hypothetical protein
VRGSVDWVSVILNLVAAEVDAHAVKVIRKIDIVDFRGD